MAASHVKFCSVVIGVLHVEGPVIGVCFCVVSGVCGLRVVRVCLLLSGCRMGIALAAFLFWSCEGGRYCRVWIGSWSWNGAMCSVIKSMDVVSCPLSFALVFNYVASWLYC